VRVVNQVPVMIGGDGEEELESAVSAGCCDMVVPSGEWIVFYQVLRLVSRNR
jgi:hypothetical protein